jgi:hypothetical protein
MRTYTFNNETGDEKETVSSKRVFVHRPFRESDFKESPYLEFYVEDMPEKGRTLAIRVQYSELRALMQTTKALSKAPRRIYPIKFLL